MTQSSHDGSSSLSRYGFYVSLFLLYYGTLFPFHFDFSRHELAYARSQAAELLQWTGAFISASIESHGVRGSPV